MDIVVVSRQEAKNLIDSSFFLDEEYDLISISDTHAEKDEIRKLWINNKEDANAAIFLTFPDTDQGFTENKARQIINFSKISKKKGKSIVIHCLLGVSRSKAVGKFLEEYLGVKDKKLVDYTLHNRNVYYTLQEVSGHKTLRSYYKSL